MREYYLSSYSKLFAVLLTALLSLFVFGVSTASAATCNITGTETVNAAYVTTNSCTAIDLAGTFTVTWDGAIDLGGGTVTVSSGTVTFSGALDVGASDDFVLASGATITHGAADTDGVQIDARNVTITGDIDVDGKGYAGGAAGVSGTGTGGGTAGTGGQAGGGGGHGGAGGKGGQDGGAGGITYGDQDLPQTLGSGGGGGTSGQPSGAGGNGGGRVQIVASGNLTVNGNLTAKGSAGGGSGLAYGRGGGGGAGGSIYLNAGTYSGTGTFNVSGGAGGDGYLSYADGGGGGAGRIFVTASNATLTSSNVNSYFTADGGTTGGAQSAVVGSSGTIYFYDSGDTMRVYKSGYNFTSSLTGDFTILAGTYTLGAASLSFSHNGTFALDGVTLNAGSGNTLTLDATTALTVTNSTLSLSGVALTFDNIPTVTFTTGASLTASSINLTATDLSVINSAALTSSAGNFDMTLTNAPTFNTGTITIGDGYQLTCNDSILLALVSFTINGGTELEVSSFDLDAASTINANGRGYAGGAITANGSGSGAGQSPGLAGGGGGAAYGGNGGAGGTNAGAAGASYGSNTRPNDFGSGGGGGNGTNSTAGADGGGLVEVITTGNMTINGSITANGDTAATASASAGRGGGGGAGGGIYLSAGALAGSGSLSANGGNGGGGYGVYSDGGGAGGGRIAILYGTNSSSFLGSLSSATNTAKGLKGGTDGSPADGSDGTLYTLQVVSLVSSTITDTGGYTSDTTPVITLSQGGATPTHVAFSCNNSDWSTWLTYPDDDVVNDGDGPAFDITTGATGCSASDGSKTIYAKIKDGTSTSSVVSDTTTYDGTSPSGLGSFLNTVADSTSMTFTWTASSDTNFDHYEIWYGAELTDVQGRTGTAAEWDNGDDSNLATAGTTTTTITGADLGNKYYKIWAVDLVSNSETLTELFVSLGGSQSPNVYAPTGLTVEDYEEGAVKVSWSDPTAGEANQIMVYRGIEPYPVNGTPITYVSVGTEYYIDYGVEDGDVVTYMLKGKNGTTYSSITSPVSFTVGSTLTTEDTDTSDTPTEDTTEDTGTEEATDTSDTTIGDTGGSSGSSAEPEGEEDEEEEDSGQSLDDLGISVPDHWSEGYLKNLGEEDRVIEEAVQTTSFFEMLMDMFADPNKGMNRGEALQFLLTLADYTATESAVNSFDDVDASHERGYLIEFAADNGLVQGYPDGTFRPEEVVNRAEALKMAAYFFGLDAEELYGEELLEHYGLFDNPFVDVDIEAWYAPHVIFAYANGVVQGYQDGTHRFGPENEVTYAEFVKIATLMRDFENAVELASELE